MKNFVTRVFSKRSDAIYDPKDVFKSEGYIGPTHKTPKNELSQQIVNNVCN